MTDYHDTNITLFIDTNSFIHLRDLKDLPWRAIFPKAKTVDLMISSRIIEELDVFKVGSNGRKRDRARMALRSIKAASKNEGMALILRESPLTVRIVIADLHTTDWTKFPKLDSSKPDDHLVADTYNFENGAKVFSFDSGPIISARRLGIDAIEPPDSWFLDPEPTTEQLNIRALKKQLEAATASNPIIESGFGAATNIRDEFKLIVPILPALDARLVDKLTNSYITANPPHHIPVSTSALVMMVSLNRNAYSAADKARYLEKYGEFEAEVRQFFENLHEKVNDVSHAQPIPYFVSNDGSVAADGLRIDCSISDEFYLLADEKSVDTLFGDLNFPIPPKKPKLGHGFHDFSRNMLFNANRERDPTAFYWQKRPEVGERESATQCKDFRATEIRDANIWVCLWSKLPTTADLKLKISATNLRKPISINAKIILEEEKVDWLDKRVQHRLPEVLNEILESQLKQNK
ncbi:MAG: hypothetical protein COA69_08645 [Robiginitomaculum sp.]|nr:MAG: hypothetical protein COA69_08645 [Robiginitomaculum sp.]